VRERERGRRKEKKWLLEKRIEMNNIYEEKHRNNKKKI